MKINKVNAVSFSTMFINAFLSLPILIINIYKKKESIFLISLFLAVLGFFFVPENEKYDIARYYQTFVDEIYRKSFFENQGGVIAEYLVNILVYLKLPPNFLPFISAFGSYYFLLKTFELSIDKHTISNLNYLILFFISYISIPIIGYTGIRSLFAAAIFIFGVLKEKNKYMRLIYLIFSIFIHTSMLIPVTIFYFCILFLKKKIKYSRGLIFVSIFLGILLTPNNFIYLIDNINKLNIIYIYPNYILGKWGMGFMETKPTLISKLINYTLLYLRFVIVFYFNIFMCEKNKKNNFAKENFILLFSCFCFILYRYFIFWERYTNILIFIMYFVSISKCIKKQKIKYNLFGIIITTYFILNLIYDLKRYYICFYISYSNPFKISIFNMIIETLKNYL